MKTCIPIFMIKVHYIIKDKGKAVFRKGKDKISQEATWKLYAGNYMKDSICVAIVALPSE